VIIDSRSQTASASVVRRRSGDPDRVPTSATLDADWFLFGVLEVNPANLLEFRNILRNRTSSANWNAYSIKTSAES
jgi:hypothetical protein